MSGIDGRLAALGAALLFGSSTPAAKRLLDAIDPLVLAGLFYAGAAIALAVLRRLIGARSLLASRADVQRLAAAIACGGIVAPLALFWGLTSVTATAGSLLLTTETAFTVVFAAAFFGERLGRRTVIAVVVLMAGAALVGWEGEIAGEVAGLLAIVLAAALWALDNNLTRDVRTIDATAIAMWKGIIAGSLDLTVAGAIARPMPDGEAALGALVAGAITYGGSLVLFVFALRGIGAARTGAVFATGPAFGAVLGILWLGEPATMRLGVAAMVLVCGLLLLFRDEVA